MSTEEMVARCIKKDQIAWDEFIRRYQNIVRKAAYYKLYKTSAIAPSNDVDDIVQEVFLMLWRDDKLSKIRDVSRFSTWLTVVTIYQTATYRRQKHKREQMAISISERICEDALATLEDTIPCKQPDPVRIAATKEVMRIVERSIEKLGNAERRALKLKVYSGKRQFEIARIMDIPIGTVASLICRAKMKVRTGMARELCL